MWIRIYSEGEFRCRCRAVVLLGQGRKPADVAEALLINEDSVRDYFKRYKKRGVQELLRMSYVGGEALSDDDQLAELDRHLKKELYPTDESVARWVDARWGVRHTESGMTAVSHRLGYTCKKSKLVPGKANRAKQEAFLTDYDKIRDVQAKSGDAIYFADAVHPQHNPISACGWIKRGADKPIPSNTGRRRLNINGAMDVQRCCGTFAFDRAINADSTIDLFQRLEAAHPEARRIVVICDNARYHHAKKVAEDLETSRIHVEFLPAYSPNLNLIERFWNYFKSQTLYNRFYTCLIQDVGLCSN